MIPHLAIPIRVANGRFVTVEQNTAEEIAGCATAALRTPYGHRASNPDFGLPDQLFKQGGADPAEIAETLARDEPRAAAAVRAARPTGVAQAVSVILNGQDS